MLHRLRDLFLGSPLPTYEQAENRLNKIRALAAFSPDALSSIAYANQEIYLGLIIAGTVGLRLSFPIGLAIVSLLIIVALSYAQTIFGYPSGGGSYVVARENLGTIPGLIAAAALLIDYVLTAAVSLTAGVEAIASTFPGSVTIPDSNRPGNFINTDPCQLTRSKRNRFNNVHTGVPLPIYFLCHVNFWRHTGLQGSYSTHTNTYNSTS